MADACSETWFPHPSGELEDGDVPFAERGRSVLLFEAPVTSPRHQEFPTTQTDPPQSDSHALGSPSATLHSLACSVSDRPFTSFLTTLRCAETGHAHDPTVLQSVSHGAGATLLPEYDLDAVRASVTPDDIRQRPHDLWRFRELLPLDNPYQAPDLGAGATPLFRLNRLGNQFGLTNLWLKDEGANPTGPFKARGPRPSAWPARTNWASATSPSPPPATPASAWAAYCAAWGITLRVVMPVNTPDPIKAECIAYGADVTEVRGVISDARPHRLRAQRPGRLVRRLPP